VSRRGVVLQLNISNEVDHFIYFKYKDTTFDHLHDEIIKARTIIDVGGNIGAFALLFEQLNSAAQIHTFEPHPGLYKRLQQHLDINSSGIIAHNIGLGEKKGVARLYEVEEQNPGMNRIFAAERDHPYCTINIESLDEYWETTNEMKIDFIKIDVEGFELSVLKGAYNTITKHHPVLVIEINDDNLRNNNTSASELIMLLNGLGYNCITTADKKRSITASDNFKGCHFDIVATANR
jgi:FkbM family methyltransferase